MFKKLSATILFMAMAFVIVAEQPSLEYCLCENSLHLAGSECCTTVVVPETCCHNCAEKNSQGIATTSADRCDDCTIPVIIDVSDYCWFTPTDSGDLSQIISCEFTDPGFVPPRGASQTNPEQIAPPDPLPEGIPLFLGNLSLRL